MYQKSKNTLSVSIVPEYLQNVPIGSIHTIEWYSKHNLSNHLLFTKGVNYST